MQQTNRDWDNVHWDLWEPNKPLGDIDPFRFAPGSPVHDWRILFADDWHSFSRNVYGKMVAAAWFRLKSQGLCGKVAPDGSDVWDAGNVTKRHN